MRVETNKSYAIISSMMPLFKQHLRVLHDAEDTMIELYLQSAIESIGAFAGIQIMQTENTCTRLPSEESISEDYTHFPLSPITSLIITDSNDIDVSANYQIDLRSGTIYPALSLDDKAIITSGYSDISDVPANITSIVFRYGAHLYEHREAVQIGDPKFLPDWVNYALASINKPRV